MFFKYCLDHEVKTNPFQDLLASATFETTLVGRQGANLVDWNEQDGSIPLVRTTTHSNQPNQKMLSLHHQLLALIKTTVGQEHAVDFNNALMEVYDARYRKMKYHSDQTLDLETNSWIAIFSCYKHPPDSTNGMRRLRIKKKNSLEEVDIILNHNSVVLFSTDTNSNWWHKIILSAGPPDDNLWLGLTFRQSKTWISFRNEQPYFVGTDQPLLLADKEQQQEFYQNRRQENTAVAYIYPDTPYTISVGDIIPLL